ncbi:uncharacterized protein LOC119099764 [Pollicipes pollicipes]|uniref:uncharacterized protein LOC119099764 n=1 Tax=Pollicipes pollicipes TaxID=41117 RepID=UPI00188586B3|nr:uncharacterized protein LOC119099764 [Pollicipes pollicipes]
METILDNSLQPSLALLEQRRATPNRLEPLVPPAHRRRSSGASTASLDSTADGSRRGSAVSQRSSSLASECSSHSYELAALRRPSTLSRLSQTLSLSSQRGSVYFVKGPFDDAQWAVLPGPQRLTFTQRLAFPTLAGGEMRHKRRDPFNETEAHMNLFAKLITVVILCLVFVLLIGVMYKFLR